MLIAPATETGDRENVWFLYPVQVILWVCVGNRDWKLLFIKRRLLKSLIFKNSISISRTQGVERGGRIVFILKVFWDGYVSKVV